MKRGLLGICLTLLGLVGLIALCGEASVKFYGPAARGSAYAGGAGALFAALCGLPFLVKIAGLPGEDETGAFWKFWGLGLVTRTGIGLLAAVLLLYRYPGPSEAGVLTLALTYFVALMVETVWVATRLSRTAKKQRPDTHAGK